MTNPTVQESSDAQPDALHRREKFRAWVQIARTYSRFTHRMHQVFSSYGLTGPQFDVLATLHRKENIMQQELASRLLVTKGNLTGVIDRMEAVGWIKRRPDPEDRRANRLHLTNAGREKFAEVLPEHHAVIESTMAQFSVEEVQTLTRLLLKFEQGVEK